MQQPTNLKEDFFFNSEIVDIFDLKKEVQESCFIDISGIQDSFGLRSLRRARLIAVFLIDEQGEFNLPGLIHLVSLLEQEGFISYLNGVNDGLITEHQLRILKQFVHDRSLITKIRQFHSPLCHPWAEKVIRESVHLVDFTKGSVTSAMVRRAVLSALLTPIRQTVGSCFATAPAILIQKEQPNLFLEDMYQLLGTGKLKRTFGGVEYAVPMSPSTGVGDLFKTFRDPYRPWFNPGLIRAFEQIGLIDPQGPFEGKANQLKTYMELESANTVGELIHHVLLRAYCLNKADIAYFKKGNISHCHRSVSQIEKMALCQKMEDDEQLARAVFKGGCDHPLLRVWEFTIASFSEVKMEFSRWNLYTSLGFHHLENGGIGQVIHRRIDEKITEINETLQKMQLEYELAHHQVKETQSLLSQASTTSEIYRLKLEYQSRSYHMQACLEMRDCHYEMGTHYSNLVSLLIFQYDLRFPEYFQEIYDAQMQEIQEGIYDDSPAGFRLVYKHGRADPSVWTLIYSEEQYIASLINFFNATERSIAAACTWKGGDLEVSVITSEILRHIQTPLFLTTALQRMKKAHRSQLNLGHAYQKPWAYVSGGTMTTLLNTYYCRQNPLTEEGRWVENATELLVFLIDVIKNQSHYATQRYLKNPSCGLLVTSPTHAFVLQPGLPFFRKGWEDTQFTYTWVRDYVISPPSIFYSSIKLDAQEQMFLAESFCEQISDRVYQGLNREYTPSTNSLSVIEWRYHFLKSLGMDHQIIADKIDAFLYEALPIIPSQNIKKIVTQLLEEKYQNEPLSIVDAEIDCAGPFVTTKWVKTLAKWCFIQMHRSIGLNFDLHQYVEERSYVVGLSPQQPMLWADTNWSVFYFGFVINPGTGNLELWRMDRIGSSGVPMSMWRHWLDGSDQKPWAIYTHPHEYSFSGERYVR